MCNDLNASTYHIKLTFLDAEFQYDRHKLTVYYTSEKRVDFRELVRDLFAKYKSRIWMKKVNNVNDYYASKSFANMALATGASTSATAGP
jgi:cell fate regulator YaaT (PSP1 superfamily)